MQKVALGLGGYKGGGEATWVTSYKGNGEALKLIKETAMKYNQDAVLMMFPKGENQNASFDFGEKLNAKEIDKYSIALAKIGFEGWTWERGNNTTLRVSYVPEWDGPPEPFAKRVKDLHKMILEEGEKVSKIEFKTNNIVLSNGRDY